MGKHGSISGRATEEGSYFEDGQTCVQNVQHHKMYNIDNACNENDAYNVNIFLKSGSRFPPPLWAGQMQNLEISNKSQTLITSHMF